MAHADRKAREKEAVRTSILNAARKIALEQGWHALTIRKIADEIEYTAPIVYEHFDNKETLIDEIILTGFRSLHDAMGEVMKKGTDSKEIIMGLSLAFHDFAFENRDLFQLMFSLERKPNGEEMKTRWGAIFNLFNSLVQDEKKSVELMFNWICLQQGIIMMFMKIKEDDEVMCMLPPRKEFFIHSIERFISAIH